MFCSDHKASAAPAALKSQAVGTIREVSKPGGLKIKKWLQSRKAIRHGIVSTETRREADPEVLRGNALSSPA
jgi:hypothetical protein